LLHALELNVEPELVCATDGDGVGNVEVILLEQVDLLAITVEVSDLEFALGGHVMLVAEGASDLVELGERLDALGQLLDGDVVVDLEAKLDVDGAKLLNRGVLHGCLCGSQCVFCVGTARVNFFGWVFLV